MSTFVAVGYDGSQSSQLALDTAVAEARARSLPLQVLYAAPLAPMPVPHFSVRYADNQTEDDSNVREVTSAVETKLSADASDLEYTIDVTDAISIAETLIERSDGAALLVVGSRGLGGFKGLLLGSTSAQVAAHARCPVLVTRRRGDSGPHPEAIVVAVDESTRAQEVLGFAFAAAVAHRKPIVAVHAWRMLFDAGLDEARLGAGSVEEVERDAAARLSEMLEAWRDEYPNVAVTAMSPQGTAREVLLDQARGCRMLVMGNRGRGPIVGMLLGSTSQAMLHHAESPVVIVRQE